MEENPQFKPAWWLRGAHGQTIWSTLAPRQINIELQWERVELPDGDFIDLVWEKETFHQTNKPITLLLHGLEGSIESSYAKGLMSAMIKKGQRPVLMHFRGCSGAPNRLARGYHAGETTDLSHIIRHLRRQYQSVPISAVGISIGGNILLKWLGETESSNDLQSAVAVSVPFQLQVVADRLMQGPSRLYQTWLMSKIKQNLTKKMGTISYPLTKKELHSIETFWQLDEKITAPMYGFKDVHHYYKDCSCRKYLATIKVPTLIIHSKDDPMMTPEAVPETKELSKSVKLNLTEKGGHVGFIGSDEKGKAHYWLESSIPDFLNQY